MKYLPSYQRTEDDIHSEVAGHFVAVAVLVVAVAVVVAAVAETLPAEGGQRRHRTVRELPGQSVLIFRAQTSVCERGTERRQSRPRRAGASGEAAAASARRERCGRCLSKEVGSRCERTARRETSRTVRTSRGR